MDDGRMNTLKTVQRLQDWIASLPPFDHDIPRVSPVSQSEAATLYRVEWDEGVAALKHFSDTGAASERPARIRASAEAAGLRLFSPSGLAPQLLWEGSGPPDTSGYGVLYRWADGVP